MQKKFLKLATFLTISFVTTGLLSGDTHAAVDYETDFTDSAFLNCVINSYNSEHEDSPIVSPNKPTDAQLQDIRRLNCDDKNVTDTSGIEELTNIKNIFLDNNSIQEIDISQNTQLEYLYLHNNNISELNTDNNEALKYVYIGKNNISQLDFSNNPNLSKLYASGNQLTSLDFSQNLNIHEIVADKNKIESITFPSNSSELTKLRLNINKIQNIDLSGMTNIEHLQLACNELESIDIRNNSKLKFFNIGTPRIEDKWSYGMSASGYSIPCGNSISDIDLSHNEALETVDVSRNELGELDISSNTVIKELYATRNKIREIDLSGHDVLEEVWLDDNLLTNIDISQNTVLTDLLIRDNQLTSINVSDNEALEWLGISGNPISKVDLSRNPNLVGLYIFNTSIGSVDVSNNPKLYELLADDIMVYTGVTPEIEGNKHTYDLSGLKFVGEWSEIEESEFYQFDKETRVLVIDDINTLQGFVRTASLVNENESGYVSNFHPYLKYKIALFEKPETDETADDDIKVPDTGTINSKEGGALAIFTATTSIVLSAITMIGIHKKHASGHFKFDK